MVTVGGWLEALRRRWSAFDDTLEVYEAIVGSRVDKASSAMALTTSQTTCYQLRGMTSLKGEARQEVTTWTVSWTRSSGIWEEGKTFSGHAGADFDGYGAHDITSKRRVPRCDYTRRGILALKQEQSDVVAMHFWLDENPLQTKPSSVVMMHI